MAKRLFNKEFFIRSVKYNVRTLFRKEIEEATEQQIFQAVGYAVKDAIMDAWIATQKEYEKSDPKIVYYMSMEFLMGRALGNNLINLTFYDEVKEALEEIGLDLNTIEDQEPDAALGNGGGLGDVYKRQVSLILWQHWDTQLMAAVSVTVMVCSNSRSLTDIR